MTTCCTCPQCRAAIRATILSTFDRERRWMGPYTVRFEGRLGWVPSGLYFELLTEMCSQGVLIHSHDPASDPFPRLLPARLMGRPAPVSGREVAP